MAVKSVLVFFRKLCHVALVDACVAEWRKQCMDELTATPLLHSLMLVLLNDQQANINFLSTAFFAKKYFYDEFLLT